MILAVTKGICDGCAEKAWLYSENGQYLCNECLEQGEGVKDE